MTAPTADPKDMQIMQRMALVLGAISQANGYYTDVKGAGIEPLAFDDGDQYPQIVVHDEGSDISDTKSTGYQDDLTLAAVGYMPFVAGSAIATALRLRDDITQAIQRIKPADFRDAQDVQMVSTCALAGNREIKNSDQAENFVEVVVRCKFTYRKFIRP